MGLDMYLTKRTFVGNEYQKPEEQVKILIPSIRTDTWVEAIRKIRNERISYITERVGYWRKANAIHAWFVKEVQGEEDDCREYAVGRRKLEALLRVVGEVIAGSELVPGEVTNGFSFQNGERTPIIEMGKVIRDPALAQILLPTQSGFFFGCTDYNEWYWHNLVLTKEILEVVMEEDPDGDYYYHASW